MQCCHPGITSADNLLVTLGTKKFWESLPFGLQIGQFKDSRTVTAVYINSKRNLKAADTQIRLNFVISIAVAQLIFILGIDATQTKVSTCIVSRSNDIKTKRREASFRKRKNYL